MSTLRTTLIVTAALATAVTLAACSSTGSGGSMTGMNHSSTPMNTSAAASFNTADVTFVTGMIPHHTQAVAMADTLLKKSGIDPAVTALAHKIKGEQAPEITTMTGWLAAWKVPTNTASSMPGMDMGTGTGMMSDADMTALDSASGLTASKLFLTQMIQHHQGAIGMATTEKEAGKSGDALALATGIISSQSAEISTMKNLLTTIK
jgi:uncharacterized protein (DUF305 family)